MDVPDKSKVIAMLMPF